MDRFRKMMRERNAENAARMAPVRELLANMASHMHHPALLCAICVAQWLCIKKKRLSPGDSPPPEDRPEGRPEGGPEREGALASQCLCYARTDANAFRRATLPSRGRRGVPGRLG